MKVQRLLELAGVRAPGPEAKKLIKENIEDQHAELVNEIEELLTDVADRNKHVEFTQRFDTINEMFDAGYESDDWSLLERAIESLEKLRDEIKTFVASSVMPGPTTLQ